MKTTDFHPGLRRKRSKPSPVEVVDARFEGSAYSNAELEFLVEHLGELAIVAMPPEDDLPEGVNDAAIGPLLDRTMELDAFQSAQRDRYNDPEMEVWCGFEKLRDICRETLAWNAFVKEMKSRAKGDTAEVRRAAAAPSLHMWDPTTDTPYLFGVGSDAERCLTAIDENGHRKELYINIRTTGTGALKSLSGVAAMLKRQKDAKPMSDRIMATTPTDLEYSEVGTIGIVKCPICGKAETYVTNQSSTKRKAIKLIHAHLETENRTKMEQHRLLGKRLRSGKSGDVRIPAGTPTPAAEPVAAEE